MLGGRTTAVQKEEVGGKAATAAAVTATFHLEPLNPPGVSPGRFDLCSVGEVMRHLSLPAWRHHGDVACRPLVVMSGEGLLHSWHGGLLGAGRRGGSPCKSGGYYAWADPLIQGRCSQGLLRWGRRLVCSYTNVCTRGLLFVPLVVCGCCLGV